jgi:hypothetical protein
VTTPASPDVPQDAPQDTPDDAMDVAAEFAALRAELNSLRPKPATTDERLDALSAKFDKFAEDVTGALAGRSKPAAKSGVKSPTPRSAPRRQNDAQDADGAATRQPRRRGWFTATE